VDDDIYIANWLKIGHYKLCPSSIVVCGVAGIPLFGRIRVLVSGVRGDKVYIIVEKVPVVGFDYHFYAYETTAQGQASLQCIERADLYDHHPLTLHDIEYKRKQFQVICPRYRMI
jgi:hypothetical protein